MDSFFITFKQLMHDYHNVLDKNIQRKFEWSRDKIESFCSVLTCSASEYIANPKECDCKKDMGNIHRFEIPENSVDYNPKRYSFYNDDGGHRILESSMVTKALHDIIKENNNIINWGEEIVSEDTIAYINSLLRDIKQNFIPQRDFSAFKIIMGIDSDAKVNKNNKYVCEAFDITKQYYTNLLAVDVDAFRDTCVFLTESFGFVAQNYKPTSMTLRREKYNAVNNVKQEQEKIHRMASTIAEIAEKFGCSNFLSKHNEAMSLLSQEYKINADNGMEAYYYIKLSNLVLPSNIKIESSAGAEKLCNTALNYKLGSFDFFNSFFDDIRLYGSLRGKKFDWNAMDTKENRYLSLLSASIVDVFTYSRVSRMATTAYFFHILKNGFIISNNCLIEGVKPDINKKKLTELLTYIFIYKLCITSRCDNNVASDERGIYVPLMKTINNVLIKDDVMDEHIKKFKNLALKCIELPAYQYISTSAWTYDSKSTRFAACLIAMEGQRIDECFKDAARKFFNFNGYDIDHIIPLVRQGKGKKNVNVDENDESWKNEFYNLRIFPKVENRADNAPMGECRYIGVDTSFPKDMHNKVFDKSCLKERSEWIIKKIHFIVDELLNNLKGEKKDISEQILSFCTVY